MHGNIALASKRRRTPSGQLSRAGQQDRAPAQIKTLLDDYRNAADPRRRTELGRLYLNSTITESMYNAGIRWAELAAKYQSAIGVSSVQSASLERGVMGSPLDPDSPDGQKIAKREADAADRFRKAHAVVSRDRLVENAVRSACERDEAVVGMDELHKLRTGLMLLVSHWDLTNAKK